jgi:hypothetical protein
MTPDVLSLPEIEKRYPDQWVVLDHVRSDPGPVLRGGRVIFATEDEDALSQRLRELPRGVHYAIRFLGDPPPDVSFAL